MRILLLTQYYYPEPVEKVHDLACGLIRRGHEVTVLTGNPCYPKGKFYEGYRNLLRLENLDGVRILRVPQFPDHSRSGIRRVAYYLSFAVSALVFGVLMGRRPDVVLVYLAALPVGLTGWLLSRVFRIPFVLDVVDLWPESVSSSGMLRNEAAERIIQKVARFVYRRAKYICAVTEGFRENIEKQGVEKARVCVINNWMPSETYLNGRKSQKKPILIDEECKDKFIVMYAGNIGPYQDVGTILHAAGILRNYDKIRFVIVGDGVEYQKLIDQSEMSGLRNVIFLGRREPEEMPVLYVLADVLVVHLVPSILADISIPSKTYAYMSSGRPVLMAVKGEAEKFVKENGFGISVPPVNPPAMAEGILSLFKKTPNERKQMGDLGRENYRKHYCGDVQIQKFERVLNSAISHK
jgi:glycosyltransferase involved in cell wall biosynthesis